MTDDFLKYHEVRIRHHDGGTAPVLLTLKAGPAIHGGAPMGLLVTSGMDGERPGTIVHHIDAQSIVGALHTPAQVAEYLDAVAGTIRAALTHPAPEQENP